jgi:LysM repeat protein
MDRICPFLALDTDLRSAMAAYDPDHRCLAQSEPQPLDRATQRGRCLTEDHQRCEFFVQRTAALAEARRTARPAPDARFISTRFVLEADEGWRPKGLAVRPLRRRRLAMTGATVLVVGAAGAALSTRGFGLLTSATIRTPSPSGAAAGEATTRPTSSPSPIATPAATARTPTATPRPPTPTPRSTPRVYVAQAGDSLSSIAARFGVTTQALMAANGLTNPNLINVGQVLVIPD